MQDKGQDKEVRMSKSHETGSKISDFVLDKVIFSNVFEKDIRRIYIYRKSERLAKALQMIAPAFATAPSLRNRLDGIAVGLIDAAILPPSSAREALSRELLALSSILSVARSGGLLSEMNAEIITREAHLLLQEIAGYEEPRLFMEDSLSLAELAKRAPDMREIATPAAPILEKGRQKDSVVFKGQTKGHISDTPRVASVSKVLEGQSPTERQEAILAILRTKGPVYIKDISTMIREVSEKTIQRELQTLISQGAVQREGDRRWTQYSIA
jgi:hypothetical protein